MILKALIENAKTIAEQLMSSLRGLKACVVVWCYQNIIPPGYQCNAKPIFAFCPVGTAYW
jgi:hypothetical protein